MIAVTIDLQRVQEILDRLPAEADRPTNKFGGIDVKEFNKLREVQLVIDEFKLENIDGLWLHKHGFSIASVILKF